MKLLVTGGAGFIGSHFVKFAIDQGAEVYNIDKLTYAGSLKNLSDYADHPKHHFLKEDICNKESLRKTFRETKPDFVIHMAAESHVDRSIDSADEFIQTNIVGTQMLLDAALEYWTKLPEPAREPFRFLHLSTDEVYGALGAEGKFDETMPYRPNSPYAASKASSDLLVRAYFRTYKFPTLIVNSSNNFGPHQFMEKLIPLVTLNALEGKPLPVYGNGQQVRDWLYVTDHVEALWKVLERGVVGEQYCIGSDNEMTNLQLVEKICDLVDEARPSQKLKNRRELITFVKDRPGHDLRYATNATKLKKQTGWAPKVSFEQGIKETVNWYINESDKLLRKDGRERIGLRLTK